MKKVLVLSYYFPPMGLSGVQRTLKFVKYLPDFGWQPTVLTVHPHAYFAYDDSLLKELEGRDVTVWRTNPNKYFRAFSKKQTISFKHEYIRRIINRASQLFFIPDNKTGWHREVLKFLGSKKLNGFDLIFSTAPPYSSHLTGVMLKEKYQKPLITDFRDLWVDNPYHFYWTPWHRVRHLKMEKTVCAASDAVIAINDTIKNDLIKHHPDLPERPAHVIPQGYDAEDFNAPVPLSTPVNPNELNFVYTGIFYDRNNPVPLYRALKRLKDNHTEVYKILRFYNVGFVQRQYRDCAVKLDVEEKFVYAGYVDHHQAIAWQKQADVLWLILGEGKKGYESLSTGKAFEYLGSRKPVMALIPDNDLRSTYKTMDHVFIAHPGKEEEIVKTIIKLAELKSNSALPSADVRIVRKYERKNLTQELAKIFDTALEKNQH